MTTRGRAPWSKGSDTDHLGPVDACPGCGDRDFHTEEHGGAVVFRCRGCSTGWRYELGFVWAVHV